MPALSAGALLVTGTKGACRTSVSLQRRAGEAGGATRAARTQAGRAGSVQQRTRARQSVGRAEAAATSRRQNQWVLEELPHRPHPCRCDFHRPHGEAISDVREGEAVPPNAVHGTPSKVVRMRTRHCSAKSQASAAGSCLRSQAEVPAAGGARRAERRVLVVSMWAVVAAMPGTSPSVQKP